MNSIPEKEYRAFFRVSIILKGIIAVGEVALGLLFAFVSYGTLRHAGLALLGNEFAETTPDFIWGYVLQGIHGFTATPQSVWVFIFLSHGLVKLVFVVALLREKLWAYPWSAGVFVFFILYQIWQMASAPSLALLLITILDVIVVLLVLHEYHYRLRHRRMILEKK